MKEMVILPNSIEKEFCITDGKMYFSATFSDGENNAVITTIGMKDGMTITQYAEVLEQTAAGIKKIVNTN